MKNVVRNIMVALTLAAGVAMSAALPAGAINVFGGCGSNASTAVCKATSESVQSPVQVVLNTLFYAAGIIAVIMIIVGGIRYVLSNGDASRIKSAKDTVLYAVIGLIVAMLSYAIVNFVVGQF